MQDFLILRVMILSVEDMIYAQDVHIYDEEAPEHLLVYIDVSDDGRLS